MVRTAGKPRPKWGQIYDDNEDSESPFDDDDQEDFVPNKKVRRKVLSLFLEQQNEYKFVTTLQSPAKKKSTPASKKAKSPRGKISPSKVPASKRKAFSSPGRLSARKKQNVSYHEDSGEDDEEEENGEWNFS